MDTGAVDTRTDPHNEPWFEHLSVKQGLSHNTVLCIHQDRQGYLWFGTQDGLNKYDGYTFTVYSPDPNNPAHTIGHSWVTDMLEDRRGYLWVTTLGGGLYRIEKQTGQVTGYRIDPNPTNPRNTCFSLCEDRKGKFWIGSAGGLNQFDPDTGHFTLYGSPVADKPAIFSVDEDSSGGLWVGSIGLYRFNRRMGNYSPVTLDQAAPDSLAGVFALYPGQQGMLWLATTKGLYQLNLSNGRLSHHQPPQAFPTEWSFIGQPLWQDASGMIWVALSDQSGLQRFDPTTQQWTIYRANPRLSGKLSSNHIYSLCQDQSGVLWIGTDNGLDKLMPQPNKFRTMQLIADDHSARLPQNRIRALWEDRTGTIWLSNEAGELYAYQRKTGQFTSYPVAAANSRTDWINAIYEDRSGQLWMGTDRHLQGLDRRTGQFRRYRCETGVQTIREAPDGKLWLCGQGLAVFDPRTSQFKYYRPNPHDSTSLRSHGVVTVLPGRSGVIWVATNDVGLVRLDPTTDQFTYYQPDYPHSAGQMNDKNTNNKNINDKDIRSLHEDANGVLWIGTNQGGLNRFDPMTGAFTAFTQHNGLPNNHVVGIVEDGSGNLWLATNRGICRFDPRTKACRNYDQRDGLQDQEFFEVCAKGPTGELLFGGPNGFNLFSPGSIRDNPRIPPVYINQLRVLNQRRPITPDRLEFSYRENLISFDFVALNMISPEKNQYAYQLAGFDKDWVYCGTRRFATYTNLDPGEYVFRVKASNNDGIWNEKGASLPFMIHPPFWRTGWFVSLSLLTVTGLLYGGFRYRIRQIQREEIQKTAFNKRLAEMEMQALRAQMNPHFIFNSLSSINSFILDNEPEAASEYLSKFSKLIRLILQNSNAVAIPLENELEALRLYLTLESLRFEHKLTFSMEVGEEIETAYLEIPPLIIQPYVENAIWHGLMHKEHGGHITITIRQQNGQLICTVEDNGVGRQRAAVLKSKSATRTKSMGMQITSHRLALSQTLTGRKPTVTIVDLTDPAGEPAGTRVVLTIPLN